MTQLVQLQIISKILQSKDASILDTYMLTEDMFVGYTDEIHFIKEHIEKYGNVPDSVTFLGEFPEFVFADVAESDKYLVSTIREEYLYYKTAAVINKVAELTKEDSNVAVEYLMKELPSLEPNYDIDGIDIVHSAERRLEKYREVKANPNTFFMESGFKELDDEMHGLQRGEELFVIVARTNAGKCLAKGTKVMMADGTLKAVEDVRVGDYVQSLNGVNRVEYLHSGVSNGYKIIPKNGEPFIVSSNHILTLKVLREEWDRSVGKRGQMVTHNEFDLVDVQIEDYLNWSGHKKHLSKLYYPPIEYTEKEQTIPPYILGSWLGDGFSREVAITNIDKEVLDEWENYANSIGLKLVPRKCGYSYAITNGHNKRGKGVTNVATKLFEQLNLLSNKHIPLNYLTGSREQRLELLAGLIDTDGYYTKRNNSFGITFKSKILIEQTAQLCRGLGFKVSKIGVKHNKQYNRDYYRFSFHGCLSDIPTRIPRKQAVDSIRLEPVTGFRVEPIDTVEYYGFQTDGDHRFMLWDNTLTHNSWILAKMCAHMWGMGFNVGYMSPEMSADSIGYRFDTLIKHFSNRGLKWGKDEIKEDEYEAYIDDLKGRENKFIVSTPKQFGNQVTVLKLKNWIKQYKLDVIAIDGITYLRDDRYKRGDSKNDSLTNISEDLMSLSVEMKIPIIVVVQANRTGVRGDDDEGTPDVESIRDSDGIAHNASKILSIRQKKDNILLMELKKNRDGKVGGKVTYCWNINNGEFSYIPYEESLTRKSKKDTENVKQKYKDDADVF